MAISCCSCQLKVSLHLGKMSIVIPKLGILPIGLIYYNFLRKRVAPDIYPVLGLRYFIPQLHLAVHHIQLARRIRSYIYASSRHYSLLNSNTRHILISKWVSYAFTE
jgi:hypothetical protein